MRMKALGGWLPVLLACAAQAAAQVVAQPATQAAATPVEAGGQRPERRPFQLSAGEVAELEKKVAATPTDLEDRSRLLRHYSADRAPEARAARSRHALWVIANAPEAEIAGSPFAYLDRVLDAEAHGQARSLWLAHLEASGANPRIVGNAAAFQRVPNVTAEISRRSSAASGAVKPRRLAPPANRSRCQSRNRGRP